MVRRVQDLPTDLRFVTQGDGHPMPRKAVEEIEMANNETRVLLIKPGDLLLIGNVGEVGDPEQVQTLVRDLGRQLGIKICVFSADIDIAKVPTDA
jgi:hypothetical protein